MGKDFQKQVQDVLKIPSGCLQKDIKVAVQGLSLPPPCAYAHGVKHSSSGPITSPSNSGCRGPLGLTTPPKLFWRPALEWTQLSPVPRQASDRASGNYQLCMAKGTKETQILFLVIFSLLLFFLEMDLALFDKPSRYAHISQWCHRKFILIMEMNGNHIWNHTAFLFVKSSSVSFQLSWRKFYSWGDLLQKQYVKRERRKMKPIIPMVDSSFCFILFLQFVNCTPKTIREHNLNCFTPKLKCRKIKKNKKLHQNENRLSFIF